MSRPEPLSIAPAITAPLIWRIMRPTAGTLNPDKST
jgi:hypothetical protein